MRQGPVTVLVVDSEPARRAERVRALTARGLVADEVSDAVGALKRLPQLAPDVLLLALQGLAMDLDTLARGTSSMAALGHLQILAVGDARPISAESQAHVTVVSDQATPEEIAKECERVGAKARRKRSPA